MHFKVVFRAAKALQAHGVAVLRFNFRGVGPQRRARTTTDAASRTTCGPRSTRWRAASRHCRVVLGGFSFGSAMALRVGCDDARVRALFALGFPLRMMRDTVVPRRACTQAAPVRAGRARRVRRRRRHPRARGDACPSRRAGRGARGRPLLHRPPGADAGGRRCAGPATRPWERREHARVEILDPTRAAVLVIDLQEKLLPAIAERERVLRNSLLLLRLASVLDLPVVLTTQYQQGPGRNRPRTGARPRRAWRRSTRRPSAASATTEFRDAAGRARRPRPAPGGRHRERTSAWRRRCWARSRTGLTRARRRATRSARGREANRASASRRMETAGALLSSTEMAIYELLGRSDAAAFKAMLPHLKGRRGNERIRWPPRGVMIATKTSSLHRQTRHEEAAAGREHRRRRRARPQRRAARGDPDRAQPRIRGLRHPEGLPRPARHQYLVPLTSDSVRGITHLGGSILGTNNRGNPLGIRVVESGQERYVDVSDQAVENFRRLGFDGLIAIGGDGSLKIAAGLQQKGIPIIGVPKTIDNDLAATLRDLRLRHRGRHRHRRHRQAALDRREPRARDGGRGHGPLLRLDRRSTPACPARPT